MQFRAESELREEIIYSNQAIVEAFKETIIRSL